MNFRGRVQSTETSITELQEINLKVSITIRTSMQLFSCTFRKGAYAHIYGEAAYSVKELLVLWKCIVSNQRNLYVCVMQL